MAIRNKNHKLKLLSNSLMHEYFLLLILISFIILISFFITEYIVRINTIEQSKQSAQVIFEQARDQIELFVDDVENLNMNIVNDVSITNFYEADNFADRWACLDDFYQVVANSKRINQYLETILLYDLEGNLFASKGEVFIPKVEDIEDESNIFYSPRIKDKNGTIYFQVGMPVYSKETQNRYKKIGYLYILFNTSNFQNIIDGALANEEAGIAILDQNDEVIVEAGKWSEYTDYENGKFIVNKANIGEIGWKMVSVVPTKSLMNGINQIRNISYILFFLLLIIMGFVFFMFYTRIIRPIRLQTNFVTNFTRNPGQRIKVTGNNEISDLARKMNQMLDDIDEYNKKYVELENAKRHTELIAYRSQINPHFLYNTFNCIRGIALYRNQNDIADITLALSTFFRYSVHGSDIVTVKDEINNLQNYAKILDYRFNGKHRIVFKIEDSSLEKQIPKMLIQPLVENAIMHGLEPRIKGDAYVSIDIKENRLIITIKDEGIGIPEDVLERIANMMDAYNKNGILSESDIGIGIMNVYRRIKLYYGNEGNLFINSIENEGSELKVDIPSNYNLIGA